MMKSEKIILDQLEQLEALDLEDCSEARAAMALGMRMALTWVWAKTDAVRPPIENLIKS